MATVRFTVDSVPPGTLTMIADCVCEGSVERLATHMVDFGAVITGALHSGAKIATGNTFLGFHTVGIDLRSPLLRITNIGLDTKIEMADLPTYRRLGRIAELMQVSSPDLAMNRLANWFWSATQIAWFYYPLFVMDHRREEWREYRYDPIWNARDKFEY